MALCEGSTLKLDQMALRFLPLILLPKPSMHTKIQLLHLIQLLYRKSQSFLQKHCFDANLNLKPPLAEPNPYLGYWTITTCHRHAWATWAGPSARVHRVST